LSQCLVGYKLATEAKELPEAKIIFSRLSAGGQSENAFSISGSAGGQTPFTIITGMVKFDKI